LEVVGVAVFKHLTRLCRDVIGRLVVTRTCVVLQVTEKGQQLLQLVACPSLEHEFTDFMESWVTASSEVDSELKRFDMALCTVCLVLRVSSQSLLISSSSVVVD